MTLTMPCSRRFWRPSKSPRSTLPRPSRRYLRGWVLRCRPILTHFFGMQYWAYPSVPSASSAEGVDQHTSAKYHLHLRKTLLSMAFNRVDVSRRSLNELRAIVADNPLTQPQFEQEIKKALLWALMGNRVDFVKLFAPLVCRSALGFCLNRSRPSFSVHRSTLSSFSTKTTATGWRSCMTRATTPRQRTTLRACCAPTPRQQPLAILAGSGAVLVSTGTRPRPRMPTH